VAKFTTLVEVDAAIAETERRLGNLLKARDLMAKREELEAQIGEIKAKLGEMLLPAVSSPVSARACGKDVGPAGKRGRKPNLHEFRGKLQTLEQWAAETGIATGTLFCRLKRGWSIGRALTEPEHKKKTLAAVPALTEQGTPRSQRIAWEGIAPVPPVVSEPEASLPAIDKQMRKKKVPDGTRRAQAEECKRSETAPVVGETPAPVPASMLQANERPARGQRSQQIEECRRLGIRGAKAVAAHLKINVSYAGYLCSIHGLNVKDSADVVAVASESAPSPETSPAALSPRPIPLLEEDRASAFLDRQVAEIVGTPETDAKIAALESRPVVVPFGISFTYDPAARAANRAQLKEETVKRQRGGKGRTVEFITVAAKNHVHVVTLDHFGDGQTNEDATGHVHRLCRWEMIEAHGHDHGLALTPPKGVDCAT